MSVDGPNISLPGAPVDPSPCGGSGGPTPPPPVNDPPTADAGGPYVVNEGGTVTLTGSGTDPDSDPLTYA